MKCYKNEFLIKLGPHCSKYLFKISSLISLEQFLNFCPFAAITKTSYGAAIGGFIFFCEPKGVHFKRCPFIFADSVARGFL